jgi:hypothetical protein
MYYCENPNEDSPVCGLKLQDFTPKKFKNKCFLNAQKDAVDYIKFTNIRQNYYIKLNDGECKESYTLSEIRDAINIETENLRRLFVVGSLTTGTVNCKNPRRHNQPVIAN